MADVVALIPARSGSKGVPGKNIRMLGGRPLLAWTIEVCRKAAMIDRVIVSTDSQEYAAVAERFGAEVPFLRPPELARDDSGDLEFVAHCLDWLAERGQEPRLLAHMRPTTPLRDPEVVDRAIRTFASLEGEATSLRSVHEMTESSYKTFEIDGGHLRMLGASGGPIDRANNPRQSFPTTYAANGYADVLSVGFIRSRGLLHGERAIPFFTPPSPDVDCEEDFKHLEHLISQEPTFCEAVFSQRRDSGVHLT
ncbi:MAG: acylneuraminate cytidylyltransferase family protein [Candidatus Nanopelagicales bacterium]|nr:acylneuraminate cytidylyltransferase family protein [Candidatus Nanopelagicales bacterium]